MIKTLKSLLVLIGFVGTCFGAPEPKVLVIPPSPLVEQEVSEKMRERISALEAEGAFMALDSWRQIPELPAWAFVGKKREIAFVFANPAACDAYRYAVILGRKNELIVVRAGGIAGTYEIFVKPKKPNQASLPTSGLRPAVADM